MGVSNEYWQPSPKLLGSSDRTNPAKKPLTIHFKVPFVCNGHKVGLTLRCTTSTLFLQGSRTRNFSGYNAALSRSAYYALHMAYALYLAGGVLQKPYSRQKKKIMVSFGRKFNWRIEGVENFGKCWSALHTRTLRSELYTAKSAQTDAAWVRKEALRFMLKMQVCVSGGWWINQSQDFW